jgi:MFS family permease
MKDSLTLFPNDFSYNVRLVMLYNLLDTSFRGIWNDNMLSIFTYLITNNSNFLVGLLTGAVGATQILFTLVTAIVADKYSRPFLLRIGGVFSIIGILSTTIAVHWANYQLLFLSMIIWGAYWALTSPPRDALLSDSVGKGNRSRVYAWSFTMKLLGQSIGPLVSVIMFVSLGNNWKVHECKTVMFIGIALCIVPTLLLFLFDNSESDRRVDSTGVNEQDGMTTISDPVKSKNSTEIIEPPQAQAVLLDPSPSSSSSLLSQGDYLSDDRYFLCFRHVPYVPAMIALGDVIGGLASGMSIKFFPIFFMNKLAMQPVDISLLYTVRTNAKFTLSGTYSLYILDSFTSLFLKWDL